jgi:type I restriction enzyme M protein
MFEQAFKNIDDILRREAGCATELDYTEQMSWLLFLKYLADLEHDRATEARLEGKSYAPFLDQPYRWEEWALREGNGRFGQNLLDFVNHTLFPYLQHFRRRATSPNSFEYKIGEIFSEIHNKFVSGDNLREAIYQIDKLRFGSEAEKQEILEIYEAKIRNIGTSRNGGEYYTPRPLIRAMLQIVQPRLGEHVYDGACGSAGFLCESFDYLNSSQDLNSKHLKAPLSLVGKEKKSFAYVVAIMNMILHGIEAPNILHTNSLLENLADIQEKDRFEVVLSNPPFGGNERGDVQDNFPIHTRETSFLFLQHFISMLKSGGRAGVVVPRRFLSNTNNASVSLRRLMLERCNLHTVLDCPSGTLQGCDLRSAVLFFVKGKPTRKVWFYQLDPGRNLTKTKPLNDADLAEFVMLQETFADSPKSWSVDVTSLDKTTFALASSESRTAKGKKTMKNPLKVFICHGSEDKPVIRELYSRLQGDGVKPWLDERDILPGQDWNAEIKRAARSSDCILVCLSSTSVGKSGYVQKEIKFALDVADEKPDGTIFIIPVKLGECDIPERLSRWQWVQFLQTDGYTNIMRSLRARATQCGLQVPGGG